MDTCQETSGFLFKHPCSLEVMMHCEHCDKALCNRHQKHVGEKVLCVSCAKTAIKVAGPTRRARGHKARGRDRDIYYEDDPYFYSDYHYSGYGNYGRGHWGDRYYSSVHDRDDFTEADGQSFHSAGDENFEQDMGGS